MIITGFPKISFNLASHLPVPYNPCLALAVDAADFLNQAVVNQKVGNSYSPLVYHANIFDKCSGSHLSYLSALLFLK